MEIETITVIKMLMLMMLIALMKMLSMMLLIAFIVMFMKALMKKFGSHALSIQPQVFMRRQKSAKDSHLLGVIFLHLKSIIQKYCIRLLL